MILEEETFEKFRHFPSDLKPKSGKQILAACDKCGLVREIRKNKYRSLCMSCAHKGKTGSNRIRKVCLTCGKIFMVLPSQVKIGKGKYCSKKCVTEYLRGENSPAWKGGISFEPYCHKFNEVFKEYIRDKFDNVCFLCGKTEEENGQKLSVHHVSYNKDCGCAETEAEKKADDETCQFIPLCISCNTKVNSDRDMWELQIKNEMKNKLNGWYI